MNNNQQIDLRKQPAVRCENCDGQVFREVVVLKKVSRLLTGHSDDTIAPLSTYVCDSCGHFNKDLDYTEKKINSNENQ